jgi:hypothetical protein
MEWNQAPFVKGSGPNGRVGVLVSRGSGGSPRSVQELALRVELPDIAWRFPC